MANTGWSALAFSMNGRAQDGEHLSAYAIVDSTVLEEAAATIDRAALLSPAWIMMNTAEACGRHSDFGVGAAFRVFTRFAVQVEVDHVFGLPAGPSGCVANDPCAAAAASVAGLFLLSTSRVQPYVMGGMVFLRTETADYVVAPATALLGRATRA